MDVRKNLKLMQLFYFFIGLPFSAAIQVIYFAQVSGSYALAMSIYSVTMVTSAIFEVPTGIYSDLIGRKKTSVLGSLSLLTAVVLYASAGNYPILVIGAIFEGLSRSFFSGNDQALLYDTLAEINKGNSFNSYLGKLGSAEQTALAIAAIIGGLIAHKSLRLVMWLSIIPIVLLTITAMQFVNTKPHKTISENIYEHLRGSLIKFKHNYKLRLLSLSSIVGYAFGESSFQFSPIFVNSLWPMWAVGLSRFLSFAGASVSFYYSDRILRKVNSLKFLFLNNVFGRAVNTLAFLFPNIFSPILMNLPALTYGTHQVARESLIQKEFTNPERATMSSINSFFGSVLFGVVSLMLGFFADKLGPRNALLTIQVFLLIPLYINWVLYQRQKHIPVRFQNDNAGW